MTARAGARWRRLLILGLAGIAGAAALLLIVRWVLFQGPYLAVTPLPDGDIVDLHCHAAGIGAGDSGCHVSSALRSNPRFRIYLRAFGVTEDDLRREGDALVMRRLDEEVGRSAHLRSAVVLALDGVISPGGALDTNRTEVYVPNEFVARETAASRHLLFGASVNPNRPDALERLDWCASNGAVLVKWIPSIMEIDPADRRWIPYYRKLRELHLPLLSHTGQERSFTHARDELADPERLRLPLEQGVVVIAGHAGAAGEDGGERDLARVRRLMKEFPNLYADISALTQVNRLGALRETLAAPECHGRLVYGSDFPLINTALVSPWYFPLNLAGAQCERIAAIENPWDRDIALKQALGVPDVIFTRGGELLRAPRTPGPRIH